MSEYFEKKKLAFKTGGSHSKLNTLQTEALISHLEDHTYTKIQEICAYVKKEYGIKYTVPGMTSWMHRNNFSYKKPKEIPAKADPVKQEAFISFYENLVKTRPEDEPILFADGVHPTMATKVSYGWIRRGHDKLIATTASRTRMNLMGSLNLETMDVALDSYETIDSRAMIQHFKHLRKKYPKAPKIYLILDRGPYNISTQTKQEALKANIILELVDKLKKK